MAHSTAGESRAAYLRSKGCEVLPKPFDLDDLLSLLQRLLGARAIACDHDQTRGVERVGQTR